MKFLIFFLTIITTIYSQEELSIPDNSSQLIIVITDTTESSKGTLFTLEKADRKWIQKGTAVPIVLGKNGLGWGRGLHKYTPPDFPIKKEGDGRSPAGLFKIGSAFGFATPENMKDLKIPYFHVTDVLECIDDTTSEHYNQIVSRDQVTPDWQSSEKMEKYGVWYEQGVIIEHNTEIIAKGAGSCIFIHNWASPEETTSGCTEMEPAELKRLLQWLDSRKNPLILQLPAYLFRTIHQNGDFRSIL